MDLKLHDIVEMKKEHPCGSRRWEVLRVGMDLKLRCCGCGHEVMAPRRKLEKSIKRMITEEESISGYGRGSAAGCLDAGNAHCAIPEPVNPRPGIGVCGTWGEDRWGPLFF